MGLPQSMYGPQSDKHIMRKTTSCANLVCLCRFGDNLLHILIDCFHRAVHLGAIWYQVMMFDLELGAYFCHYVIVQVKTIVQYDSLWKFVSTYDFFLDESGHHRLCHTSI